MEQSWLQKNKKILLWTVMGAMALWVLVTSEIPLMYPSGYYSEYRAHLLNHVHSNIWVVLPHFIFAPLALLLGPVQFSSRLRRKYIDWHRLMGKVYVISVLVGGAWALGIAIYDKSGVIVGTWTQVSAWYVTTIAAFLTARNGHIAQHRQWMIRSYGVTFTFILLRVLDPWPPFWNMSVPQFTLTIILCVFAVVALPDVFFNWKELTTKRVRS